MSKSLPATVTDLIDTDEHVLSHEFPELSSEETIESADARLQMKWSGTLRFHRPATWTQDEARAEFLTMASNMARTRCMWIVVRLSDDVVQLVAPQLEEIAEYETRMAAVRREAVGPDIKERWISLPSGR